MADRFALMHHRTAVVILNWNTRHFLEKFLSGVIKHTSEIADIIVADNASSDDSVSFLKKEYPDIRIISLASNEGFTGGYNSALALVDADYFVLLNSDVDVTENWLQPLVTLMDSDVKIGAAQPKILSYHAPENFEYAGAAGGYIDKYGYPFCRGRMFNTLEKEEHQYDDSRPVFWATGACMIVRSSVYKELNGLDPRFFAHMEEIDLCWRMQNAGYSVYFCGSSRVYHVGGGSLPKNNPKKTYLNFRNNLLMLYKNADATTIKSIMFTRLMLDFVASMKFLFSGSYKDFIAVWDAHRDFKKLKSRYPRGFSEISKFKGKTLFFIYPKSILTDYYLWGKRKFSMLNWETHKP